MDRTEFYLQIAREQMRELRACQEEIRLGESDCSAHFKYALVCSVFAAMAVEQTLQELIWTRCFFQSPEPQRRITLLAAAGSRTIQQRLDFIKAATRVPKRLLEEMKSLFEYRNRIVHSHIYPIEGDVVDDTMIFRIMRKRNLSSLNVDDERWPKKKGYSLVLPGLGTPDIDAAHENLGIAERAVKALRLEKKSRGWPIVPREG